jgi:histidyl-tRNA synthetase
MNTGRQINIVPGMRDVSERELSASRQISSVLHSHLSEGTYGLVDTPLLEETELFVRKSGGEITGRLYTFTDPGGHSVSLRPEFTSSIIRNFVEKQGENKLPVRWQYGGPVFRYGTDGEYRQFTQVGAELIGLSGREADTEVMSIAYFGVAKTGLERFRLRIGHLGVIRGLLDNIGLSEAAKLFIVGNIQALKSGESDTDGLRERARDVGLLQGGVDIGLESALEEMSKEAAEDFILGVLRESMPTPMGRRSTDQIIARILRKVHEADDPGSFDEALLLADKLAGLEGAPATVLEQARNVATDVGLTTTPFDDLEGLFDDLAGSGIPEEALILDMGLARGISYYTGVIFELMSGSTEGVSLGGGGRYDGLVKALGSDSDVPAMGFAYNIESIINVLHSTSDAVAVKS